MKITSKDIILDTDERIRMHSEPVSLPLSNEDKELLQAMLDYVRNSQDDEIAEAEDLQPAVGIAAVQVGVLKLMIFLKAMSECSLLYGRLNVLCMRRPLFNLQKGALDE